MDTIQILEQDGCQRIADGIFAKLRYFQLRWSLKCAFNVFAVFLHEQV